MSFLYHVSLMSRLSHVLLSYAVQDIFEDYSSNCAKTGAALHGTIFSEVGLRKFVLASKLFEIRPYFKQHFQARRHAKLVWLPLRSIFRSWSLKLQLKRKIWKYTSLCWILVKKGVDKIDTLLFLVYKYV